MKDRQWLNFFNYSPNSWLNDYQLYWDTDTTGKDVADGKHYVCLLTTGEERNLETDSITER